MEGQRQHLILDLGARKFTFELEVLENETHVDGNVNARSTPVARDDSSILHDAHHLVGNRTSAAVNDGVEEGSTGGQERLQLLRPRGCVVEG